MLPEYFMERLDQCARETQAMLVDVHSTGIAFNHTVARLEAKLQLVSERLADLSTLSNKLDY